MNCSSCQRENPVDASFCSDCGARLAAACPDCGRSVAPDAAFCSGCGRRLAASAAGSHQHEARAVTPPHLAAKILRDRATLEGEHRTVTVLFIDAVGSVSTGARIDQEQLHRITHEATERMISSVHRFEGTVAQFRGDGIMALFGAPIAHEDTARRAIAAAIAMRDSLAAYDRELRLGGSAGFTYRIGLHTGPVIVGRIGDDLSMDYTAIGDTVNLAARMEQWAAPGKIYVTDQTRRLAAGYFEFGDLGALEVKGKGEAVRAFEVERELASRTRLDVAADRGLSPYVGRAHELSVLRSHFEQAKGGHGQVVFISGEAGMGKSRLMLEFRRSLATEDFTWLTGQCISYGGAIPYLPIVDLLKRNFGIEETDDDEAIAARLDERADAWDDVTRRAVPYVKFLLNVDPGDERVATMDPIERRAGILDALRAMLIRGSSQRPVVMLIEDLHWIDEKSEEAIGALVEVTAASRVLMILTYRPGYASSLGDRGYYNRVSLRHLPIGESDALLAGALPGGRCPEEIRRLITGKTEGNPFFLEEVTKSMVESGILRVAGGAYELTRPIDEVHIPETIQEVILSRIDRLDHDAKDAIQLASVIGREFTARLLGRMSDARHRLDNLLSELKMLELIYEKAYFPELSYMFKHALTHDVAYSTLLSDRRRALHRIVGAAIEELYADRLPEQYETLAYHYEQGEDWAKALTFLMKAGEKARLAYANQDAISFFDRAAEAARRIGAADTERDATFRRGGVRFTIGELGPALEDFALVARQAREAGDHEREVLALAERGFAQTANHEFEEAEGTLREALAIAGAHGLEAGYVARAYLMELFSDWGRLRERDEQFAATDGIGGAGYPGARAVREMHVPFAAYWDGYYDVAISGHKTAAPVYEAAPDVFMRLGALWCSALAVAHHGRYEEALSTFAYVFTEGTRCGDFMFPMRTLNCIGWIYGDIENHERALEQNLLSVEAALAVDLPDPEVEMNARLNAADNLLALGRLDEADEQLRHVVRVVLTPEPPERWMLWRYSKHYYHTQGESQSRGDAETALMLSERCLALAEETNARKNIVKARRLRGQAPMTLGDLIAAEADLGVALELAIEVRNPGQLWKTHEALGDLRRAQGRADDARSAYGNAYAVLQQVAASLADDELRDTLLKSAAVRRLQARV
jgi:class 3 adenylate cyclase/tetratricopeptide (TPR) repeat protein